jgi:urea transporter
MPSFKRAGQFIVIMNRVKLETVAAYSTWDAPPATTKFKARRFVLDTMLMQLARRLPLIGRLGHVKGTMPWAARRAAEHPATQFLDSLLRSMSQCVICNNPVTGIFVLAALFAAGTSSNQHEHAAYVGICGILGLLGSTTGALVLRVDANSLQSGLFGYNGLLVGLSVATFLAHEVWDPGVLMVSFFLGTFTTILQLAFGNALISNFKTPPLTLPFHVVAVVFVLSSYSFSQFQAASFIQPYLAADAGPRPAVGTGNFLLQAALTSVGQIVFAGSPVSGGLILIGMACCSRIAAIAAFCGALVGCGLAFALGANAASVALGLHGYNSSLSAIAALTFFMPSREAIAMAVVACSLAVLNDGAWKAVAAPIGAPSGGWPFWNIAVLFLLQHKIPGFVPIPLAEVSTPEDHMLAPSNGAPQGANGATDDGPRREAVVLRRSAKRSRTKQ